MTKLSDLDRHGDIDWTTPVLVAELGFDARAFLSSGEAEAVLDAIEALPEDIL